MNGRSRCYVLLPETVASRCWSTPVTAAQQLRRAGFVLGHLDARRTREGIDRLQKEEVRVAFSQDDTKQ